MKTPIGLDKVTGAIRFIEDVEQNGLACNCKCPNEECGADLIARFCKDKSDHFAHHRQKGGDGCQEKAVHLLAKHLIHSKEACYFPEYGLKSKAYFSLLGERYQEETTYFDTVLEITDPRQEVSLPEHGIKPDLLCYAKLNGHVTPVAIEVRVTHRVDDEKLAKIRKANLTCIEIDLSDMAHCEELTLQEIEKALKEQYRYELLFIDRRLKVLLKKSINDKCTRKVTSRNDEIIDWQNSVIDSLNKKKHITLPKYRYPHARIKPVIEDMAGLEHRIHIAPPPRIREQVELSGVKPIESGVMTLDTKYGDKVFPLPVLFQEHTNTKGISSGSYLTLNYSMGQPLPEKFEDALEWGRSEKAENYLKEITKFKIKEKKERDYALFDQLNAFYFRFKNILETGVFPVSPFKDKIARQYQQACKELGSKAIARKDYIGDIYNGWIFGCPQEHWQTLLLRALYRDDDEIVDVRIYANYLKKHNHIEAIDPVKTLGYRKKVLKEINLPVDEIPTSFKVLHLYFRELELRGFLTSVGRGKYAKLMIYGEKYKLLGAPNNG